MRLSKAKRRIAGIIRLLRLSYGEEISYQKLQRSLRWNQFPDCRITRSLYSAMLECSGGGNTWDVTIQDDKLISRIWPTDEVAKYPMVFDCPLWDVEGCFEHISRYYPQA